MSGGGQVTPGDSLEALECERVGRKWKFSVTAREPFPALFCFVLCFKSALISKDTILKVEMRGGRRKEWRERERRRGKERANTKRECI